MRSKKRLTLLVLMLMAMIACLIGAVACGGGVSQKDAIDMYILPQNQTLVDEDFSLPKYIGQDNAVEVKWASSNTAAIEIVDSGDQFTAKVTLQDEVTDVTLTISAGGASKDFTVRVDGFSVYTFIDNYSFPQLKKSISSDFDLDTSFTFQGKTATIAWSIDEQYSEYIALNEAKNGVVVTPAEEIKDVKIKATFTYGEESAPATYAFSVAPALDHRQTVNKIYSVEGYPLELSGYIVHVTDASESYGNATFYMIDDDFCSGYYCYRVKIDKSKVDKYVEGAHVTVSGDTTKNYNGLWENNSGGTATLDDKDPINPRDHIYALDTDLLSNVPSMIWHESTLVSLSGWKIASIEPVPEKIDQTTNANIFTLQRGDVTIAVRLSKYVSRTDAEGAAFVTLLNTLKVGDYVNVTGLLGNYNNFQIQPVLASDITKVDAEGTNTDGAKVKAAVAQVAEKVKANFDAMITAEKTVEMPTGVDGVTISYRVAGQDLKNVTVTIAADGKITVAPVDSEKNYDIEVTYKIGDYEGYSFFNIRNWKMSNEDLLAQVKETIEKLTIDDVKKTGAVTIPAFEDLGATVTWAPKSGSPAWLVASNGGIAVNELPDADTTVTIVATIELGGKTETAEISFKVQKAPDEVFQALDAPAAGDYLYAAMHKGTRLYASKLELDGNYIATTEDVSAAVKLTIAKKSDTEWYIKMGTQYLEVNPYANSNNGVSYSLRLVATPTENAVWEWDNEIKIFKQKPVATEDGVTPAAAYFYIGMRDNSDYTTMSPSDIKYITGSNAANLDVTQHPSRFGTMVSASEVPDETKAQNVLNSLKTLSQTTFKTAGEEFDLPTANNYDATVEWTVKGGSDYVTITANKLKVAATLPAADTKVTLQIEVTVGQAVVKADVEITIKAAQVEGQGFEPITAPAAGSEYYLAMDVNGEWYYSTGVKDGNYLGTTTEISKAAKVSLAASGDGWTLVTNGKYIEFETSEPNSQGKTFVNIMLKDAQTEGKVWKWNTEYSVFTMEEGGETYFMGTYGDFRTFNSAKISFIANDNEYVGKIGTYKGTITPVDPTPGGGDEPTPGTPLAAGNYNIVLRDETNNLVWYVTGAINNKGGLTVSHEDTTVAVLTVIYENSKYTLKIGDQYLEAYLNGTYKNMRLVDSPSSDAIEWKWSTEYSTFYAEYTDETRYLGANYYQSQVDNLYDNAVTLSKEMNFTGSNPVVIHYEAASTTPGGGDDPTPGTGGGSEQPEEGLLYTLDATIKGSSNSYAGTATATVGDITWTVMGNTQTGTGDYDVDYWRFGGKSSNCTAAERKITAQGAITGKVMRVVIEFGTMSKTAITVNSITLKVYKSDPSVAGAEVVASKDVTYTKDGTVTITADGDWTNCYFELVMNLTATATSNTWIEIKSIKFYSTAEDAAAATSLEAILPDKQYNA